MDLDLGDVFLDDCFALTWRSVHEDLPQLAAKLLDGLDAGRLRLGMDQLRQFRSADLELVEFGGEVPDSAAAGAFVERLVLERGQVAVDRCLGGLDLAGDGVEFGGVLVGAGGAEFLARRRWRP